MTKDEQKDYLLWTPLPLWERLLKFADAAGKSIKAVIVAAIEEYLCNHEQEY